jgi:hypothetical protein
MGSKKQQPPQQTANDNSWEVLREMHRALVSYAMIPGGFVARLRNPEDLAKITAAGKFPDLMAQMEILDRDVQEFAKNLAILRERHITRRGHAYDQNDRMVALQIFESYLEWGAKYERVIVPILADIISIYQTAGLKAPAENIQQGEVVAAVRAAYANNLPQLGAGS